jgi:vacuolar protein sorting-associated protein 13A/C
MLKTIANALGTALSTIDDAPIILEGFHVQNIFDTKTGIVLKLIEHYKIGIGGAILRLLGSINIIGNQYLSIYN